jgi:hypothetical protein
MARSMQLPLYIVGRTTNNGPPQTSFHMTSFFDDIDFVCIATSWTCRGKRDVLDVARRGKRDVLDVAREMSWTWQRDVLDVAREMSWTWQERRLGRGKSLGRGKRDVLDVRCLGCGKMMSGTWRGLGGKRHSWRWQERRLGGGKRTLRGIISTWLLWERHSWRWQERRLGGGKRDVKRYHIRCGCYGRDTPRRRNSDCVVGI